MKIIKKENRIKKEMEIMNEPSFLGWIGTHDPYVSIPCITMKPKLFKRFWRKFQKGERPKLSLEIGIVKSEFLITFNITTNDGKIKKCHFDPVDSCESLGKMLECNNFWLYGFAKWRYEIVVLDLPKKDEVEKILKKVWDWVKENGS